MKKRILLVEDEKDLVMAMKFRLESAGYEVSVAMDGEAGLDKAKAENPDLILLDLMLPKINGYKVCGLLKGDSKYNKIPIIMVTARTQEVDRMMGEIALADLYITKPFEPDILLATIKEMLK